MALQDKLGALKAAGEPKMPPEVVDAFHRGKRELIESRVADHALEVGETAPTFTLPDYLRRTYAGIGTDLAQINGEPSWTLPMPARYLIGENGAVAHAEVYPDYTQRRETSEIASVLESLAGATAIRKVGL